MKTILRIVILRTGAIGDSLLTFPILRALRAKYTNVYITLVGNAAILPLAQAWGLAEEVYDQSQLQWSELQSVAGIRSSKWLELLQEADLAIFWHNFSSINDQFKQNLLASGAREVIFVRWFQVNASRHMVEQLAGPLALQHIVMEDIAPFTLRDNAICLYNPPVAIHPGCAEESRRWSAASFAAIINRLLRLHQPVLLLAGPDDAEQLREVRGHLSSPPKGLLTVLRNVPLLELAGRIKQCKCYLGNDTGTTHLAALLGVPTIALFLRGYMAATHPIGPAVEVIAVEDLEHLSVESVFESIQRY